MSFIGRQLAEGAVGGLVGKLDEFLAFVANEPLPDEVRANYERISRQAFTALGELTRVTKRKITGPAFKRNVEKTTTQVLNGVGSAAKKFFFPQTPAPLKFQHRSRILRRHHQASAQNASSPLSGFIKKGEDVLKNIATIASKEAKKHLLGFFSNWIVDGIDVALDSFKSGDAEYLKLKGHIDRAKERMLEACKEGDFKKILDAFKIISRSIEDAPIYFNGIPLLRTSLVEDSGILKGISNAKALKTILEKTKDDSASTQLSISAHLDILAKNLAIQNTFNLVFHKILDLPTPEYQKIFETPRLHLALKALHSHISSSGASRLRRIVSHASVSLLMHFFYHILKFALDQFEKKLQIFIHRPVNPTMNYSKVASLFAKLNAAHVCISDSKKLSGTLDELIMHNMEAQQAESSVSLYGRVQSKFLSEFSLKLPLTQILTRSLWKAQSDSTIINVLTYPLKTAISVLLFSVLIIPEFLINLILSQTLKVSFFWNKTLPSVIMNSLNQFSDYTKSAHPINLVIVDHLQKVWNTLKSNYTEVEEQQNAQDLLCPVTKQSLDLTLRHLFELLEKTPFETPEQLIHYLQGHSPLERTKLSASRFFLNQTLSAFTTMIAQAVRVSLTSESKEKIMSQALMSINQGFAKKQTLTQKQMRETEEKINILLSQILSLTIRKTIEKRYNFTPKNQSAITDRFLKSLREETAHLIQDLEPVIKGLNFADSITKIAQRLDSYCDFIQNKQLEIRSHADLPKNPRALINQWYCEPIQDHITAMTSLVAKLKLLKVLHIDWEYLKKHLKTLSKNHSLDLTTIDEYMTQAGVMYHCADTLHPLIPHLQNIFDQFSHLKKLFLIKSTLETLHRERDMVLFVSKLDMIIKDMPEIHGITADVRLFKHSLKDVALSEARRRLEQLLLDFHTKINLVNLGLSQRALDILDTTSDLDFKCLFKKSAKDEEFKKTKEQLIKSVTDLDHLCESFKPIEHFNIKLISTNDALEIMQNFAFGCIIGPMEELLKLIKKPYIWQYGIINHLCYEFLE